MSGPTNAGNGALDATGGITVSGGTLFAAGSAGMAETPDASSAQGWLGAQVSGSAGATVTIATADGTVLGTTKVRGEPHEGNTMRMMRSRHLACVIAVGTALSLTEPRVKPTARSRAPKPSPAGTAPRASLVPQHSQGARGLVPLVFFVCGDIT